MFHLFFLVFLWYAAPAAAEAVRVRDVDGLMRALANGKTGAVVVARGDYPLNRTLRISASGFTLRGEAGARLLGGRLLKGFRPAREERLKPEARPHVLVVDLKRQGITEYGRLRRRGFVSPVQPAHSELFFNGKRMTLARWPNADAPDGGWARIAAPADPDPPDDEHGQRHGRLEYGFYFQGERPARWRSIEDVWVHGFWSWDWANSYEAVAEYDRERGFVKTKPPHGLYGFRAGQRFHFLNVLEELDQPGEYHVDAARGLLYFWPPAPVDSAEVILSTLAEPLIEVAGARDVTIEGLTLEATRGTAVEVAGGERVRLANLNIRNVGNHAVHVKGGLSHSVDGCEIYQTGDAGIVLEGGDRPTLSPAGHAALNNRIHHIAEWSKTYQPGIRIAGVGHRVAHNLIHDAPHTAILLSGNDHVIEFNEIHHVCLETGDVGAFYMGRDYTERGIEIRHNYFHHTGGIGMGSMAVYLDDCASGATVFGNVFYRTPRAVFIGGGRDNLVENNLFIDCEPAVHIDARGIDPRPVWQNMVNRTMRERLEAMRWLEPPYITRYPALRSLLPHLEAGRGVPPEGNIVRRNICIRGKFLDLRKGASAVIESNWIDTGARFVDEAGGDFRLQADSPALAEGFVPIPWEKIGPARR
jgi:hypothetical protein